MAADRIQRSTCDGCQQPILWARTADTGRSIPLDPEPAAAREGGLFFLTASGQAVHVDTVRESERETKQLYRPHRLSCTNKGGRFARPPKPKPEDRVAELETELAGLREALADRRCPDCKRQVETGPADDGPQERT